MNKSIILGSAAACLVLTACDSEPAAEQPAPATPEAPAPVQTPPPTPEPTGTDNPAPDEAAAAAITSAYTKYNLDDCTILHVEEFEGESVEAKCDGYKGVPLFVNVGDGRFDIDVGVKNSFSTISPFNELNDTVEWRLKDGKPFAVIARLKDVSMETGGNSALMVETVGTAGRPGCRVAHVWNTAGSTQNQRARDIADKTLEAGFTCPAQPQRIG